MPGQSIRNPFPVFFDTNGETLENGFIYIGEAGLNPQVHPIDTYWDEDFLYPAAQPIRTINGLPARGGTPSAVFVTEAAYSIKVENKQHTTIYSAITNETGQSTIDTIADLRSFSLVSSNQLVHVKYHTTLEGGGGGHFIGVTGAAPATYVDDNDVIIVPTNGDGSAAWVRKSYNIMNTFNDTVFFAQYSTVRGSDGNIYKAVIDNTGNDPVTDDQTNWIPLQKVIAGVGSPNIIGGFPGNTIELAGSINVRANIIAGGGYTGTINQIDGPETRYATISGGYDNYINGVDSSEGIDAAASTISGGAHHEIKSTHASIGGGSFNLIGITCTYSGIFAGTQHTITDNASSAFIGGGSNNTVNSVGASIVAGTNNEVTGDNGIIGGGSGNTISSGSNNTITGGINNDVSGGNAVVLSGTTNTVSSQGGIAAGREAVVTARGGLCISSDDALGEQGYTNSEENSAAWKFRNGQRWLGDKLVTIPFSDDGGMKEVILESTVELTATATVDFPDEIPSGALVIGCQLRVNSAVSHTMDVAYNGAAVTQAIATALGTAQNTRANTWFDVNAAKNITSGGTTKVTITRNGGGSFTAGGEVYMQVRFKQFFSTKSV